MKKSIIAFFSLSMIITASAQQCIQGNCKNGKGVQLIKEKEEAIYRIGVFSNSLLEGEGAEVTFKKISRDTWGRTREINEAEVDLLLLTAIGNPSMQEIINLKPQLVKKGIFKSGRLEGQGSLYINAMRFPELDWVADMATLLFSIKKNPEQIRYDGNFSNHLPAGFGIMQAFYPLGDTLFCASENVMSANQADMVLEVRGKNWPRKGLTRGRIIEAKPQGWFISNVTDGKADTSFARQLWIFGSLVAASSRGSYPFDEAGSISKKTSDSAEFTGSVNGFGQLRWLGSTGKVIKRYTGYFNNGAPDGFGYYENMLDFSEKGGYFRHDSLVYGKAGFYTTNTPNPQYTVLHGNYFNKRGCLASGYGNELVYASHAYAIAGKNIISRYYGNFLNCYYHGYGTYTSATRVVEGQWNYGKLGEGKTELTRAGIYPGVVLVINGQAIPVILSNDGVMRLATGEALQGLTFTLSKHSASEFFTRCGICNGSKTTFKKVEVGATAGDTWTRDVTTYKDAVSGYWVNTSRVTTTFGGHAGYSYNKKVYCDACNRDGNVLLKTSVPEN